MCQANFTRFDRNSVLRGEVSQRDGVVFKKNLKGFILLNLLV